MLKEINELNNLAENEVVIAAKGNGQTNAGWMVFDTVTMESVAYIDENGKRVNR